MSGAAPIRPRTLPSRLAPFLRGVLTAAGTVLGLVVIVFFLSRVLPNDPVISVVGADAPQDVYDRVRIELGLDQPLWYQFAVMVGRLVTLDFGKSFLTGNPVLTDVWQVLPATVELGLTAVLIGGPIGVVLGIVAAAHHGRWPDDLIRFLGLSFYSTPSFLKALIALMIFYHWLGWTEGPGRVAAYHVGVVPTRTGLLLVDSAIAGEWEIFRSALAHLVLPLSVLVLVNAAWFSRFARTFALEELGKEYVLVARIKGVPRRWVIWRHVLRNMLAQLLTVSAVAIASSLEGSVLVEAIFAWPGFGQYFVQTLLKADLNAVIGCTFLVGVFFVTANMVAERLYRRVDPRTRA